MIYEKNLRNKIGTISGFNNSYRSNLFYSILPVKSLRFSTFRRKEKELFFIFLNLQKLKNISKK